MKKKMHYIVLQMLLIGFCELLFVAVIGIVSHADNPEAMETFPWYLPLSLVLIAAATALPSLLLYNLETSRHWKVRIAVHFLLLAAIVISAGKFFHWYDNVLGAGILFIVFCVIYLFVWAATYRSYQRDDERINQKLSENRKRSSMQEKPRKSL